MMIIYHDDDDDGNNDNIKSHYIIKAVPLLMRAPQVIS